MTKVGKSFSVSTGYDKAVCLSVNAVFYYCGSASTDCRISSFLIAEKICSRKLQTAVKNAAFSIS